MGQPKKKTKKGGKGREEETRKAHPKSPRKRPKSEEGKESQSHKGVGGSEAKTVTKNKTPHKETGNIKKKK